MNWYGWVFCGSDTTTQRMVQDTMHRTQCTMSTNHLRTYIILHKGSIALPVPRFARDGLSSHPHLDPGLLFISKRIHIPRRKRTDVRPGGEGCPCGMVVDLVGKCGIGCGVEAGFQHGKQDLQGVWREGGKREDVQGGVLWVLRNTHPQPMQGVCCHTCTPYMQCIHMQTYATPPHAYLSGQVG